MKLVILAFRVDATDFLVTTALGIAAALISQHYLMKYRRRAAARDHVIEVSQSVAIPERCVSCASRHAPYEFALLSVLLWEAREGLFNPKYPRQFPFRFCLYCSRRLRRRRRYGTCAVIAGVIIPACSIVLSLFVPRSSWFRFSSTFLGKFAVDGDVLSIMLVVVSVLAAPVMIALGLRLLRTSPVVTIVDTGEGTIVFQFKNQMFRDYFADMNGEAIHSPALMNEERKNQVSSQTSSPESPVIGRSPH